MTNINYIPNNTPYNFERRILNPSKYPVFSFPNGNVGTHLMSWGERNNKGNTEYIAYPSIIQKGNKLVLLEPEQAYRYAITHNEFRPFSSARDAEYYTKHYKDNWGRLDNTTLKNLQSKWYFPGPFKKDIDLSSLAHYYNQFNKD